MDWVLITEADAKSAFTEYEWTALTEAARASGASDLVTTVITRAVNRVRGYVESCDKNVLGESGYVPAVLYDSTLMLVFQGMALSLPAAGLLITPERQKQIDGAINELKMVARCELKISPPGSTQSVAADSPAPDTGGYGGADPVCFGGIR